MRRTTTWASVIAAAVFTLAGCGGSSTPAAAPRNTAAPNSVASTQPSNVVGTVTMVGGKPQGGAKRITTKAGQPAVLLVTSDIATEIHVHGADRHIQVPAKVATPVDVSEAASGSYEVEDHSSNALLVQLRVS